MKIQRSSYLTKMRMVSEKKRKVTLFNNITWKDTVDVDDDVNDATANTNIC